MQSEWEREKLQKEMGKRQKIIKIIIRRMQKCLLYSVSAALDNLQERHLKSLQCSPVGGGIVVTVVAFVLFFSLLDSGFCQQRTNQWVGRKPGRPGSCWSWWSHLLGALKGIFSPVFWRSKWKVNEETCPCCKQAGERTNSQIKAVQV